MLELAQKIEALLFALGKPLSRADLAKMTDASPEDIEAAIKLILETKNRGIVLVDDGRIVELRTAPEAAELVAKVRREEFTRELGRAGAEVIAILLYKGPSTRIQIDFIRGVNSTQALRTLSMRGLVRKVATAGSERSIAYELTSELVAALGISRVEEAPQFEAVRAKLAGLKQE